MTYQHRFFDQGPCFLPVGKAVCVGRNYADHAKELGNDVPETPILFMKPNTAFCDLEKGFSIPTHLGECHFETELTVLIGERLSKASLTECKLAIAGLGIGLDLTLRDVQNKLKEKKQPWEFAKAFDNAAPLSPFLRAHQFHDLENIHFSLIIDGKTRQVGDSGDMLTPILPLLSYISRHFTLLPGDIVMTGTPKGVGPLHSGEQLQVTIENTIFSSHILE